MNIVLTPKDADFILKYLRFDLECINEKKEKLEKGKVELRSTYDESDIKDERMAKYLLDLAEVTADATLKGFDEIKKDLNHCIELLTVGSEVSA